jgi:hypothetical protein
MLAYVGFLDMEETLKPMGAAPIELQPEQVKPTTDCHSSMLPEARRKFCAGIVRGLSATEAYHEAYPRASHRSAYGRSYQLMRLDAVKVEIARLRAAADRTPGSAMLDCAKKRRFLARVVRASLPALDPVLDGDLLQVCETDKGKLRLRLFDKIRAIELDNELAGEGSQAEALDEVGAMIRRIMLENVAARRRGAQPERPPAITLSGPHRKFCEGIVRGLSATAAYHEAYPHVTQRGANRCAFRLMKMDAVKTEIERLKAAAAKLAGAEALSLEEKQRFVARLIHANLATLDAALDGDLLQSYEVDNGKLRWRLADKLRAIAVDNDLAGKGAQAQGNDDFAEWAARLQKS